jgi:serine/threonine-protein kinase
MLDSGKTPEEVCRDCPDLLPAVQDQWEEFCHIDAEVEALLPGPGSPPIADSIIPNAPAGLPHVPGYELEAVLGRGGMGVVYKARHLALKRTVALKMTAGHSDPADRVRFKVEAEAVARLQHPNIVQIHEIGEVNGVPFFALEFVEGGSLANRLAGRPLPPRDAACLVTALAEAMHLAHSRNLIHRDLKPANVLLTGGADSPIGQCQPKVTDFGLARQLDADSGQTQVGAIMGTPSYMAPEQAEGRAHAAGPAADVYALGTILYECLTGRPPFRGATPLETLEQVRTREPAPPSALNRQVPRDLEIICLKCLRKPPERRYSSARELADDLGRFVRGEPILARAASAVERVRKWVWRRPAAAGLLATALALVGLAIGGGLWLVQQQAERRAELRSEVDTAVAQAVSLRKRFQFHEARGWLDEARRRLGPAGLDDLRRQVDQEQTNLVLVENLDKARLRVASSADGDFEISGAELLHAEALFEQTLAKAGLGGPGDDSQAAAARVRNSATRAEIVAALDDWASITPDPARRAWLLAMARRADPDPLGDRLRRPELWDDGPGLTKLLKELPVEELSPQLTTALGRVLLKTRGDAVPLLSAVQVRYPEDFGLNFELGWALLLAQRLDESLGYYRVALALRPKASPAHNCVGTALRELGRWDEAIGQIKQALDMDPNVAGFHSNLGRALAAKGLQDEAIARYQEAIRLDPTNSSSHYHIGMALHAKGRLDEAISHFQESIRGNPKASALAHVGLGFALYDKGRQGEAIAHYQVAVRLDPNMSVAHYALGLALWAKGRLDEAISHFQESIRVNPKASALARSYLYICQYDAACFAVRKSAVQGSQETRPGEQERVGLRRQALDWLQADLELRTQLLKDDKATDLRSLRGWSLSGWQTHPALASVRDGAALTKLPDAEREQWQRLWAHVAALLAAADPLEQGPVHAERREWDKAARCYKRVLERSTMDGGHFWFEYAAVLLLSGDRTGYEKACARMVERYGKSSVLRAYHVARACTLASDAVADTSQPGRLAETELKAAGGQFWSLTEQGALHYRAGQFQEAVALFEQSLRASAKPGHALLNWLWLALAQQRLGKTEEARRWLEKATAWLDQYRDGMPAHAEGELGLDLHNWLEANVLRREAEAMIRPPASR